MGWADTGTCGLCGKNVGDYHAVRLSDGRELRAPLCSRCKIKERLFGFAVALLIAVVLLGAAYLLWLMRFAPGLRSFPVAGLFTALGAASLGVLFAIGALALLLTDPQESCLKNWDRKRRQAASPALTLDAIVIQLNRDFSSKDRIVNSILSRMTTREGRTYSDWLTGKTTVKTVVNSSVADESSRTARAIVEMRQILGDRFSLDSMHQADFEGTEGVSGYVFSHWTDSGTGKRAADRSERTELEVAKSSGSTSWRYAAAEPPAWAQEQAPDITDRGHRPAVSERSTSKEEWRRRQRQDRVASRQNVPVTATDAVQQELERQLVQFPGDDDLIAEWKRVRLAQGLPLTVDRPEDERRRIYADFQRAADSAFLTWDLAARTKEAAGRADIAALDAILQQQGQSSTTAAFDRIGAQYGLQRWQLALVVKEGETKSWSRQPVEQAAEPSMNDAPLRDSLRCAYCNTRNRSVTWPRAGDYISFYFQTAERTEAEPGAFRLPVDCPQCGKQWFVVWDADPT